MRKSGQSEHPDCLLLYLRENIMNRIEIVVAFRGGIRYNIDTARFLYHGYMGM